MLTIREHFDLFGGFRNLEDDEISESLSRFCDLLNLSDSVDHRVRDLSGGQKRKVCVALSLIGNPPIVVMDEPTAGVDFECRQLIWRTIASLHGTTTIVTSHALEEAEAVSSRLFVVSCGQVAFTGTATELRQQVQNGYVLRVDGDIERVFQLANEIVPGSRVCVGRSDTILMPVCKEISTFIRAFEDRKSDLGVGMCSLTVEHLEDGLLKLVESVQAEVTDDGRRSIS
jgi:ABC-type multidrug transport system ATPase subunit